MIGRGGRQRGQSFVEAALTLPIVFLLLMGMVDLGFVLYAHVQVAAAAGEGARAGSLHYGIANEGTGYQTGGPTSKIGNDPARWLVVKDAVQASMGRLDTADTANFNPGTSYTNQIDVKVGYDPATPSKDDPLTAAVEGARTTDHVVVTVQYRQPVFFKFLPGLSNSRIQVSSTARMRIQ